MGVHTQLAASDLVTTMQSYRDLLRAHQERINRLNVYPVPDGDTGTNMALTLDSVVSELTQCCPAYLPGESGGSPLPEAPKSSEGDVSLSPACSELDSKRAPASMAEVCKAVAHGSLMGARGNSGVILCQLLRGFTDGLKDSGTGPKALASALVRASEAAYGAVMRPVEGTILTVARSAGQAAAERADSGGSLLEVLDAARSAATESLARTPELLPVLAKAGVVDAGGAGYVLLFDAFLHALDGRPMPEPLPVVESPTKGAVPSSDTGDAQFGSRADGGGASTRLEGTPAASGQASGSSDAGLRYEVMYLLTAPDDAIAGFKDAWAGLGDSIVVVGGDGLWNCHIHTDDIGGAIEAAIDVGRPSNIRVTDLTEQVEEERWVREGAASGAHEEDDLGPPAATAVVAVATGDGIRRIFRSLGVRKTVVGGQTMNPSTAELLEAVEAVPAQGVIILPNNDNIRPVAEQVIPLTTKDVRVVATPGIVEGFAALMSYDPQADVDTNASAMTEGASRVVAGEVTAAVRDAETPAGPVAAGEWMGLSREGIEVVDADLRTALKRLLDRLVDQDHEIVTLIEGEGASAGITRDVSEWLHDNRPGIAVEVHHGGQPLYPYLISIE